MKYVANDGTIFETYNECIDHEVQVGKKNYEKDVIILDHEFKRIEMPIHYARILWHEINAILFKSTEAVYWFEHSFGRLKIRNNATNTIEINRPLAHCYNEEFEYLDEQIKWATSMLERKNKTAETFDKIA